MDVLLQHVEPECLEALTSRPCGDVARWGSSLSRWHQPELGCFPPGEAAGSAHTHPAARGEHGGENCAFCANYRFTHGTKTDFFFLVRWADISPPSLPFCVTVECFFGVLKTVEKVKCWSRSTWERRFPSWSQRMGCNFSLWISMWLSRSLPEITISRFQISLIWL